MREEVTNAMDPSLDNKTGSDSAAAPPDTAALLSSGEVMAEATQDFFRGQANEADKDKLASAAADMLGAASFYGKLDDKGYGGYVDKAEVYLKQYGGGDAAAPAAEAVTADAGDGAAADAPATDAGGSFLVGGDGGAGKSDGGGLAGNVMKMAGGFFK